MQCFPEGGEPVFERQLLQNKTKQNKTSNKTISTKLGAVVGARIPSPEEAERSSAWGLLAKQSRLMSAHTFPHT